MKIRDWLSNHGKKQIDLAAIIGSHKVRAHRIFHGAIPNPNEMQRIFDATGGAVTANDFYGITPTTRQPHD